MSEWGTAPPAAGNHRLPANDPRRLTTGLQAIVQNTGDLHQIARRLSSVRGKDPAARRQFSEALGRTKQAMEDTAAALAAVGPSLPRAHLDKITREYAQAKASVAELEERGRRLLEEGERAESQQSQQQQQQQQQVEMQLRAEDPTQAMIEERNRDLERLAADIGALRDIMTDAQKLVAEQGQQLDVAAGNAAKADENVAVAEVDLGAAERLAKKRRIMIAVIVAVVIVIIVVIVLIILGALDVI